MNDRDDHDGLRPLTVRLPASDVEALEEMARRSGLSLSSLSRLLLRRALVADELGRVLSRGPEILA